MKLAQIARELGHDVVLLTTDNPGAWFENFIGCEFKVLHATAHPLGGLFHIFRVASILNGLRCDMVMVFNSRLAQAGLSMLAKSTVVVSTIRGSDPTFFDIGLANEKSWDVVVCNSSALEIEARRRAPNRAIVCIRNCVDADPNVVTAIEQRFLDNRVRTRMLFVGRIVEQKGVRLLPTILDECCRREIDVELTIVGDGDMMEWLSARIEASRYRSRVKLLGRLSPKEVTAVYRDSHVLLLPTYAEGMPNVVLEAMASGCVPIVTRLEGITDSIIEHGVSGFLVNVDCVNEYVESVRLVNSDRNLWVKLSQAGIMHIQKNFSLKSHRLEYAKFFENVARGDLSSKRGKESAFPVCLKLLLAKDLVPPRVKLILRWFRKYLPEVLGGLPSLYDRR